MARGNSRPGMRPPPGGRCRFGEAVSLRSGEIALGGIAELAPLAGARVDAVRVHAERLVTLELRGPAARPPCSSPPSPISPASTPPPGGRPAAPGAARLPGAPAPGARRGPPLRHRGPGRRPGGERFRFERAAGPMSLVAELTGRTETSCSSTAGCHPRAGRQEPLAAARARCRAALLSPRRRGRGRAASPASRRSPARPSRSRRPSRPTTAGWRRSGARRGAPPPARSTARRAWPDRAGRSSGWPTRRPACRPPRGTGAPPTSSSRTSTRSARGPGEVEVTEWTADGSAAGDAGPRPGASAARQHGALLPALPAHRRERRPRRGTRVAEVRTGSPPPRRCSPSWSARPGGAPAPGARGPPARRRSRGRRPPRRTRRRARAALPDLPLGGRAAHPGRDAAPPRTISSPCGWPRATTSGCTRAGAPAPTSSCACRRGAPPTRRACSTPPTWPPTSATRGARPRRRWSTRG